VKHLLLVPFLLAACFVFGQGSVVLSDRPFQVDRKPDTAVLGRLERQIGYGAIHSRGKEMFYWINLMRKDPSAFQARYVKPFLDQFPEAESKEANALAREMQATNALPELQISNKLMGPAQEQASFLAQKGSLSHNGRGGKGFQKRMEEAGVENCAGENLFDGQDDALMGLILLLIDKGVPGAGHRVALLNPQFREMGIGISYMTGNRLVVVQQFSCKQ